MWAGPRTTVTRILHDVSIICCYVRHLSLLSVYNLCWYMLVRAWKGHIYISICTKMRTMQVLWSKRSYQLSWHDSSKSSRRTILKVQCSCQEYSKVWYILHALHIKKKFSTYSHYWRDSKKAGRKSKYNLIKQSALKCNCGLEFCMSIISMLDF